MCRPGPPALPVALGRANGRRDRVRTQGPGLRCRAPRRRRGHCSLRARRARRGRTHGEGGGRGGVLRAACSVSVTGQPRRRRRQGAVRPRPARRGPAPLPRVRPCSRAQRACAPAGPPRSFCGGLVPFARPPCTHQWRSYALLAFIVVLHFGKLLHPQNSPPAFGPCRAVRRTIALPHFGHLRSAVSSERDRNPSTCARCVAAVGACACASSSMAQPCDPFEGVAPVQAPRVAS